MTDISGHWDELVPQPRPATPADVLARLRARWPHWGFQHDGKTTWTAIRGSETLVRSDPVALRAAVQTIDPQHGE